MTSERFRNRHEAGRQLAEKLKTYANRPDVLVLALPRGGVPVAYEGHDRIGRRITTSDRRPIAL
jgi:predicted phosphoribosyltransferase